MAKFIKAFEWFESKYSWFARKFGGQFVGLLIIVLIVLLLLEILLRNVGHPTLWTSELATIIVFWTFVLPLFYTQMVGGMIRVTALTSKFPPGLRRWVDLLGSFSAILLGTFLFIASFRFVLVAVPGGYFAATHFPAILQRELVVLFAFLLIIAGIVCFIRELIDMRTCKISANEKNADFQDAGTE